MSIIAVLLLPTAFMERNCDGRHSSSQLGAQSNFEDGTRVVLGLGETLSTDLGV